VIAIITTGLMMVLSLLYGLKKIKWNNLFLFIGLVALILSILAPIYLTITLPGSFEADNEDKEWIEDDPNPATSFFGSKSYKGQSDEDITEEWGGATGWYLSVIAFIFVLISFFFFKKLVGEQRSAESSKFPEHEHPDEELEYNKIIFTLYPCRYRFEVCVRSNEW
jgi:hypothetical protein